MRLSRSVPALVLGLAFCATDLHAQVKARASAGAGHVFVESDKGTFPVAHVSGGNVVGTVAESAVGPGGKKTKRIVGTKIEPLVIEADPVTLLPWIADLGKEPQKRVNCSVLYADFNGKVQSRLVVGNAVISRVEFDAFDAGSKDALSVRVTFLKSPVLKIEISGALVLTARRQDSENPDAVRTRAVELLVEGWTVGG